MCGYLQHEIKLKGFKGKRISSKIRGQAVLNTNANFRVTSVVLTVVLLRIKLCRDVTVCHWLCASELSEGYVLPSSLGFKQFSRTA